MDIQSLISKQGIRALGIAESFRLGMSSSVLVGVVMRTDWLVDGIAVGKTTVGGMDATESILNLFKSLNRSDIQLVMIDGCIISWYNIINLKKLHDALGIPIICLTFEEPEGDVVNALKKLFPSDYEDRIKAYEELGKPSEFLLPRGLRLYARFVGIDYRAVRTLIRKFTREGKRPEPIRVARLIANAILTSRLSPQ